MFTAVSMKNYIKSYPSHKSFLDGLAFSRSIVEAVKNVFEPVRTQCTRLTVSLRSNTPRLNELSSPIFYKLAIAIFRRVIS